MEFEYYYIVIIVVVLKLSIWACVIYFRSQKSRAARANRRFVVVDSHTRQGVTPSFPAPHSDRSVIVNHEEPPATSTAPPSYAEVMRSTPQGRADKPPSYSQVVEEGPDQDHRTPIPPHFTPAPSSTRSPAELTDTQSTT